MKDTAILVRLSQQEKKELKKKAHEDYKTMSEYIRTKIKK